MYGNTRVAACMSERLVTAMVGSSELLRPNGHVCANPT